jgi:hypothetical protein
MFDQIHCSCRIHGSFGWFIGEFGRFIGKIGRYSSVRDFTVYIFNQMDCTRFLSNFTKFGRVFQKPTESKGADFLVSTGF